MFLWYNRYMGKRDIEKKKWTTRQRLEKLQLVKQLIDGNKSELEELETFVAQGNECEENDKIREQLQETTKLLRILQLSLINKLIQSDKRFFGQLQAIANTAPTYGIGNE